MAARSRVCVCRLTWDNLEQVLSRVLWIQGELVYPTVPDVDDCLMLGGGHRQEKENERAR